MPERKAWFLSKPCFTDNILSMHSSICLFEAPVKFILLLCFSSSHFAQHWIVFRISFTSLPRFVLTPSLWSRSGRYYNPFWSLWKPQTFMCCLTNVTVIGTSGKYRDQRSWYSEAQIFSSPLAINLKIALADIYWAPCLLVLGIHWWIRLTNLERGGD